MSLADDLAHLLKNLGFKVSAHRQLKHTEVLITEFMVHRFNDRNNPNFLRHRDVKLEWCSYWFNVQPDVVECYKGDAIYKVQRGNLTADQIMYNMLIEGDIIKWLDQTMETYNFEDYCREVLKNNIAYNSVKNEFFRLLGFSENDDLVVYQSISTEKYYTINFIDLTNFKSLVKHYEDKQHAQNT